MAANGDDLKYFYAERIGQTVVLSVGDTSVFLPEKLVPGRYRIITINPTAGSKVLWVRGGPFDSLPEAVMAAPLMPIDLLESTRFKPTFMARTGGNNATASDGLAFISDGGNVDVAIVRISADG